MSCPRVVTYGSVLGGKHGLADRRHSFVSVWEAEAHRCSPQHLLYIPLSRFHIIVMSKDDVPYTSCRSQSISASYSKSSTPDLFISSIILVLLCNPASIVGTGPHKRHISIVVVRSASLHIRGLQQQPSRPLMSLQSHNPPERPSILRLR